MENKFFKRIIEQYVNAWAVLACDVAVSTVASLGVLSVAQMLHGSFGFRFSLLWIATAAVASLVMFVVLRTYRTIVRYSTFHDVSRICLAIAGKEVLLMATMGCVLFFPWTRLVVARTYGHGAFRPCYHHVLPAFGADRNHVRFRCAQKAFYAAPYKDKGAGIYRGAY